MRSIAGISETIKFIFSSITNISKNIHPNCEEPYQKLCSDRWWPLLPNNLANYISMNIAKMKQIRGFSHFCESIKNDNNNRMTSHTLSWFKLHAGGNKPYFIFPMYNNSIWKKIYKYEEQIHIKITYLSYSNAFRSFWIRYLDGHNSSNANKRPIIRSEPP